MLKGVLRKKDARGLWGVSGSCRSRLESKFVVEISPDGLGQNSMIARNPVSRESPHRSACHRFGYPGLQAGVLARVPSKSWASHTAMAMNASPAKKPLTPRLAVPPLPKGEGEKSKSQPSPRGEGARRRRAGAGSLSTPLDFDGAQRGGDSWWRHGGNSKYNCLLTRRNSAHLK